MRRLNLEVKKPIISIIFTGRVEPEKIPCTVLPIQVIEFFGPTEPDSSVAKCNEAAQMSSGEYLLFLSSKIFLRSPLAFEVLRHAFQNRLPYPVAAVSGKLQNSRGVVVSTTLQAHFDRTGIDLNFIDIPNPDFERTYNLAVPTGMISIDCFLTPRKLFLESGGFNPDYHHLNYSAADYCLRALELGYAIHQHHDSRFEFEYVRHSLTPSLSDKLAFKTRWESFLLHKYPELATKIANANHRY